MRVRTRVAVLGLAAAGLMAAGLVAPAGAGKQVGVPISVEKIVVGTPPAGTQYAITLTCDDGQVFPMSFSGPDTQVVTPLISDPGMICTLTENTVGGTPSSVAFTCEDAVGATECLSPNSIQIVESLESGFTVTNTFDPSTPVTPATPVPGTPRFTG